MSKTSIFPISNFNWKFQFSYFDLILISDEGNRREEHGSNQDQPINEIPQIAAEICCPICFEEMISPKKILCCTNGEIRFQKNQKIFSYLILTFQYFFELSRYVIIQQGDQMQTVKSNLSLTDRRNTINFNLMADSVQGRLGIYAWMISKVPSWPLLASVTSNNLYLYLIFWSIMPKNCKTPNCFFLIF